MIEVARNIKDGEFLITLEEAVKYGSSFIEQADVVDSPKAIQTAEVFKLINENNVHPVCIEAGSKAIPLYRCQDIGVDPQAILEGK